MIVAVGNGSAFRKWSDLSAWMGIVPRWRSIGGKRKLLGISKRAIRTYELSSCKVTRSVVREGTYLGLGYRFLDGVIS